MQKWRDVMHFITLSIKGVLSAGNQQSIGCAIPYRQFHNADMLLVSIGMTNNHCAVLDMAAMKHSLTWRLLFLCQAGAIKEVRRLEAQRAALRRDNTMLGNIS